MSGKIDFSYPAKLSGSGGIFAGAGFLPDLEKVPDSGFRLEPKSGIALLEKSWWLYATWLICLVTNKDN